MCCARPRLCWRSWRRWSRAAGLPGSLEQQAEEIESVAAEGALLAQGAAEEDTTATFTRVHARNLRDRVRQLEPATCDLCLRRAVGTGETMFPP